MEREKQRAVSRSDRGFFSSGPDQSINDQLELRYIVSLHILRNILLNQTSNKVYKEIADLQSPVCDICRIKL